MEINADKELDIVYSLLKDKVGIAFWNEQTSKEWFEALSEKVYRVVFIRISEADLEQILINKNYLLLTDEYKKAIASFLNVDSWYDIPGLKPLELEVPNKYLGKSFYILIGLLVVLSLSMFLIFHFFVKFI